MLLFMFLHWGDTANVIKAIFERVDTLVLVIFLNYLGRKYIAVHRFTYVILVTVRGLFLILQV